MPINKLTAKQRSGFETHPPSTLRVASPLSLKKRGEKQPFSAVIHYRNLPIWDV